MADSDLKGDFGEGDWSAATAERLALASSDARAKTFPESTGDAPSIVSSHRLDMILDIPVQVTVELGRSKIPIRNLLQLAQGSVVELGRLAGEPLDVLVNGCLIAQGEVVVVNDKFGIRLTDVISPDERLRRLHR
jgi:flagellar motor switch protein FliN/FliY